MKKLFLVTLLGFFSLPSSLVGCSDDTDFPSLSYSVIASHPIVGPLTLADTRDRLKSHISFREEQQKAARRALEQAQKEQEKLQLREQEQLEELQRLEAIEKEYNAAKLARLQKARLTLQAKEKEIANQIAELTPATSTQNPVSETAQVQVPNSTAGLLIEKEQKPSNESWLPWPFRS